jgi:hypothetical protein
MADGLYKILLSVVLRQNRNDTTSPTNAFNLNNPAVQNYLTQKLKGILPNATGNITENELMTAWLLANSGGGGGGGTVTSVDITTNAGAITITGNPITTAGAIDLDFNGANTDYIDGEGNAQPFPTIPSGTVTSVGLSLPSVFSVSGSPVTTTGTLTGTLASQTANTVFAAPNGLAGTPTFRALTPSDLPTGTTTKSFGIVIDGGGNPITTGIAGDVIIPFAMTITSWTLVADQVGSIVIDVWKDIYANFPPTVGDSIAGSEKPTLSSVIKNQDLTLTTWTTAVAAGDIIRFNVDSASTVTRITLSIAGTV